MEILKITFLVLAYSLGIATLIVQIVCYLKDLEYKETVFFTIAFLLLIIASTFQSFLETSSPALFHFTEMLTNILIVVFAVSIPVNIHKERVDKHRKIKNSIVFTIGSVMVISIILLYHFNQPVFTIILVSLYLFLSVDYAQYETFSEKSIWYVTRLKDNALYTAGKEFYIPDETDFGVLKDEEVVLLYGENKTKEHKARRIAYWDNENQRLFEFITNNFELTAEKIALIYKKRWQIESLFKQLKQNFPLKYFLGDNENAIEIQIWAAMLANLLITLVKSKLKRKWAFSNMVSIIRQQLMNYINIFAFLENPEKSWLILIKQDKYKYQHSLFPKTQGAYF